MSFRLKFLDIVLHFVELVAIVVSFFPEASAVLLQLGVDPAQAFEVFLEFEHGCFRSDAGIHEGVGSVGHRLVHRLVGHRLVHYEAWVFGVIL